MKRWTIGAFLDLRNPLRRRAPGIRPNPWVRFSPCRRRRPADKGSWIDRPVIFETLAALAGGAFVGGAAAMQQIFILRLADLGVANLPLPFLIGAFLALIIAYFVRKGRVPLLASLQTERVLSQIRGAAKEKLESAVREQTRSLTEVVAGRARAEQSWRDSESRLRLITESLPVRIAYVGGDGRYQYVNSAYETWFAFPRNG